MDGRDSTPAPQTAQARRFALPRSFAAGARAALLLVAGVEICFIAIGGHVHEVIPGRVYRCNQPTPERLAALMKKHGIRTVINLRGCCDPATWYVEEGRATAQLDLSQVDFSFSAGRLPS